MKTIDWRPGLTLPHDPQDIEDYLLGCAEWLGTETIASATAIADGLTVTTTAPDGGNVPFRISGGEVGATVAVTIRVVTSSGRSRDRTINFKVAQA